MKVVNEDLLDEFRRKRVCEFCKRYLFGRAHPHHIYGKGFGGGSRLDIRENLIALGGEWDCACHRRYHDGHILRCDLLAIVAKRENKQQWEIEHAVYAARRSRK